MLACVLQILVDGGGVEFALLGCSALERQRLVCVGVVDNDSDRLLAIGIG